MVTNKILHESVLREEVLAFLNPALIHSNSKLVDATLGFGGHVLALLETHPTLHVVGIDRDTQALALASERLSHFSNRIIYRLGAFVDVFESLEKHSFQAVLMDLGVSSMQLDSPDRGFSFMREGPLDMRMDERQSVSAFTIVNTWREADLARLFWQYGEERRSRSIAAEIERRRKTSQLQTTTELAALVENVIGRSGATHPATKVFQALRIEVNRELEQLELGLLQAIQLLAPEGRLAVITFHSLEDRITKLIFKQATQAGNIRIVTKHVVVPTREEILRNPRSRSAKLRVVEAL